MGSQDDTVTFLFLMMREHGIAEEWALARYWGQSSAKLIHHLRLDELDLMDFDHAVEAAFDFDLPADHADWPLTIGEIAELIEQHHATKRRDTVLKHARAL